MVNRKDGQIVFSYPDKTTMDYHCIFMTMSQPPTAEYIATHNAHHVLGVRTVSALALV